MEEGPKKCLFVALTRLGDLVQVSPAIAGLKAQFPNTRISVLVDAGCATVCEGISGIDEVIIFDCAHLYRLLNEGAEGIVNGFSYCKEIISRLQQEKFDFSLNMSASGFSALLLNMLGISDNRGVLADDYATRLVASPWAQLLTIYAFPGNREFNPFNLVDIFLCSVGVRKRPRRLAFSLTSEGEKFAVDFIRKSFKDFSDGPLICVQLCASEAKRRWSIKRFSKTCSLLIENLNARIVLIGAKNDLPHAEELVQSCSSKNIANAVGETNISELAGLLAASDLLVTGDTGPMHIAAAVGTPVVALFLASAIPFETGPYGEGHVVVIPQIGCNPCSPILGCSRPDCHEQISPELVYELVALRLSDKFDSSMPLTLSDEGLVKARAVVLCSYFDDDGFLEFRRISASEPLDGYATQKMFLARQAYKKLWLLEFVEGGATDFSGELVDTPLSQLAKRGISLIETLISLISSDNPELAKFDDLQQALVVLDEEIEGFGLVNPFFNPIVRLFVVERENLRGADILVLSRQVKELYEKLRRRALSLNAEKLSQ